MWSWLRRRALAPLLRRHGDRFVPGTLERRSPKFQAVARMARWWRPWASQVTHVDTREALHAHTLATVGSPRMYLEFGVAWGATIRWWAEHVSDPATVFVGFDTFEGIPEAWGRQPAGSYTAHGMTPNIEDPRVRFEVGRFASTLPRFLSAHELHHPLVAHLDADLYASTATVLRGIGPLLRRGDVVIFDELLDVGTAEHEFAAFADLAPLLGLCWTPIAAVTHGPQVAMAVTASAGRSS